MSDYILEMIHIEGDDVQPITEVFARRGRWGRNPVVSIETEPITVQLNGPTGKVPTPAFKYRVRLASIELRDSVAHTYACDAGYITHIADSRIVSEDHGLLGGGPA